MRITVIEHEAAAPLGHLSGWLGLPCDVVRPYKEEEIPERAADGLIVLGGEAAAWEDERFPWLPATRALLRRAVEDGTPTLGVCLGAQLLTSACGGTVERGAAGLEAGVCELDARPAAAGEPRRSRIARAPAVQSLRDAMTERPPGAVSLRPGGRCPNRAYRLGEAAWAVQFHPEATPEIFASWAAGIGQEQLTEQVRAAAPTLRATWRPVAEAFARVVRASALAPSGGA